MNRGGVADPDSEICVSQPEHGTQTGPREPFVLGNGLGQDWMEDAGSDLPTSWISKVPFSR